MTGLFPSLRDSENKRYNPYHGFRLIQTNTDLIEAHREQEDKGIR